MDQLKPRRRQGPHGQATHCTHQSSLPISLGIPVLAELFLGNKGMLFARSLITQNVYWLRFRLLDNYLLDNTPPNSTKIVHTTYIFGFSIFYDSIFYDRCIKHQFPHIHSAHFAIFS